MPFVEAIDPGGVTHHRIYYRLFPEVHERGDSETDAGGGHELIMSGIAQRPRVILIQGLAGTHVQWQLQALHLSKCCSVCALDNRGIGWSEAPPEEARWTTQSMARDASQVLEALQWRSSVHIVGISMGGMIAQELAIMNPRRVASLTLIATIASASHALPSIKAMFLFGQGLGVFTRDKKVQGDASLNLNFPQKWLNELQPSSLHSGDVVENVRWVRKYNALRLQEVPPELREAGIGPAGLPKTGTMLKQVLAVLTHKVGRERCVPLKKGGVPIAIIHGDSDILVKPVNADILSELFDAQVHMLQGCGHGLTQQNPSEVNALIEANIRRGEARLEAGVALEASRL